MATQSSKIATSSEIDELFAKMPNPTARVGTEKGRGTNTSTAVTEPPKKERRTFSITPDGKLAVDLGATATGRAVSNFGAGVSDAAGGAAQLIARPVGAVMNFFGGDGDAYVAEVDRRTKQYDPQIEQNRLPEDRGTFNPGRLAGNVATGAALSVVTGGGSAAPTLAGFASRAAVGGALGAATTRAEDTENFWTEKAKQFGYGAAFGATLEGLVNLGRLSLRSLVGKSPEEARAIIEAAQKADVPLTPQQAIGSGNTSLTTGSKVSQRRAVQTAAQTARDTLVQGDVLADEAFAAVKAAADQGDEVAKRIVADATSGNPTRVLAATQKARAFKPAEVVEDARAANAARITAERQAAREAEIAAVEAENARRLAQVAKPNEAAPVVAAREAVDEAVAVRNAVDPLPPARSTWNAPRANPALEAEPAMARGIADAVPPPSVLDDLRAAVKDGVVTSGLKLDDAAIAALSPAERTEAIQLLQQYRRITQTARTGTGITMNDARQLATRPSVGAGADTGIYYEAARRSPMGSANWRQEAAAEIDDTIARLQQGAAKAEVPAAPLAPKVAATEKVEAAQEDVIKAFLAARKKPELLPVPAAQVEGVTNVSGFTRPPAQPTGKIPASVALGAEQRADDLIDKFLSSSTVERQRLAAALSPVEKRAIGAAALDRALTVGQKDPFILGTSLKMAADLAPTSEGGKLAKGLALVQDAIEQSPTTQGGLITRLGSALGVSGGLMVMLELGLLVKSGGVLALSVAGHRMLANSPKGRDFLIRLAESGQPGKLLDKLGAAGSKPLAIFGAQVGTSEPKAPAAQEAAPEEIDQLFKDMPEAAPEEIDQLFNEMPQRTSSRVPGQGEADFDQELYSHMSAQEDKYGLPQGLLTAVKDRGERSGSHAVSPKGAQGVFQFMPATWNEFGEGDPRDPFASSEAAARYLKHLIDIYGGNVQAAVAHYNGGYSQGRRVARGLPPSFKETRDYVNRIFA